MTLTGLVGTYFGDDDPRNVAILLVYQGPRLPVASCNPATMPMAAAFYRRGALPPRIAFQGQRAALRDWEAGGI